jgi:hypothetical protein
MKVEMAERILTDLLESYFSSGQSFRLEKKELVENIGNIKVLIYTNDHNPPHFQVISKDKKINAKFKIENCDFLSGEIDSKVIKIIR